MDAVLQPATPVPTTVKSRARARVAELRELHGWGKESPISISKPKSDSKERQREAGAKRMRNMGFYASTKSQQSAATALRRRSGKGWNIGGRPRRAWRR